MIFCNRCKKPKPATAEFFTVRPTGKLYKTCKACRAEQARKWHHENKHAKMRARPEPMTVEEFESQDNLPAKTYRQKANKPDNWLEICEYCPLMDCIRSEGDITPNGYKAKYPGCLIWEFTRRKTPAKRAVDLIRKNGGDASQIIDVPNNVVPGASV